MSFARIVFGKVAEDVHLSDIQALVDNKVEEDHHLEYKGGRILQTPEELSKWVSAFLNAEGGLIVIGVTEDDPTKKDRLHAKIYPQAIDYAPPGFTRERIEQIVYANIHGDDVPHIAIFPVRGDASKCVYLVEVPQGLAPPYQAADRKYYRRLNFTKYAMSHYEVADFLGRRRKPALHLRAHVIRFEKAEGAWDLKLRFFITNKGRAVARHVQFSASFHNATLWILGGKNLARTDDVRDGVPSMQWNLDDGVIHPGTDRLTQFAEVRLRQHQPGRPIELLWDLVAEDFALTAGRHQFDDEFFESLATDDRPYIPLPGEVTA